MTSDTKIGLLLGLVFIFVIAFLINGVPGVPMGRATNELTHNMATYAADTQWMGDRTRQMGRRIAATQRSPLGRDAFGLRVPEATSPSEPVTIRSSIPIPSDLVKDAETVLVENETQRQAEEAERLESGPGNAGTQRTQTHIVKSGENLGTIAMLHYGDQAVDWQAKLEILFAANRQKLKSPNELQIGQELVIPPLLPRAPAALRQITREVSGVGSPGRNERSSAQTVADTWYQVRDGDNLWKIAAKRLGDGNRFADIARLNQSLLGGADDVVVPGMRLRLPAP